jgi:hypothetical protein
VDERTTLDERERLAGSAAQRLPKVIAAALGEPDAMLGSWDVTRLHGGASVASGRSRLYLIRGQARVGGSERPWQIVLKVFAPVAGQDNPSGIDQERREFFLYRSGLLDDLGAGLRAPRCYAWDEAADGTASLWLEHVWEDRERAWPLARWALAARHLGQFNGAYLADRPLPRARWLEGARLRAWLDRHGPLVARIAAAPDNPAVRRWWPRPVVDAIQRLWTERDAFCAALDRLPRAFGHGDAIRRNLLARHGSDGSEETVAIDWEHAGHYAYGEEVGQTLSVASAFFDVATADLPALDEALFAGYLAGLREAGWRGDPRPVRFAYAAHAALRNAFNAVGTSVPDETGRASARQNYGHAWEELAERRAEARPFLLARADEARALLNGL